MTTLIWFRGFLNLTCSFFSFLLFVNSIFFFFLFPSAVISQSMLWLNIIFQRPIWLSLGYFLVSHFSKDFSHCAECSFTMMRLYYLWHAITMLFMCVFVAISLKTKKNTFLEVKRKSITWKKKDFCFQHFGIFGIHKACVKTTYENQETEFLFRKP